MDLSRFSQIVEQSPIANQQEYLQRHLRPVIDILRSDAAIRLGGSRYNGSPDLPAGFEWPMHHLGPYRFLAQLNFAEIPNIDVGLPKHGLLSLFVADDPMGEFEFFWGDPGYVHAEFFSEATELVTTQPPDAMTFGSSWPIRYRSTLDLPFDQDQVDVWPFTTDELLAHYDSLRNVLHESEDYLLGYPSHCSLVYNPTPGPEWISLFTADSDDALEWCWHDGDKLMIFIERKRLQQCDFSNLRSDAG
jgi:Domain of unknown function (DUF1963)